MAIKVSADEFEALRNDAILTQNKSLFMRELTSSHGAQLRDASKTDRENEEFQKLLSNAFSTHEIFLFKKILRRDLRSDSLSDVSRWFHEKYFQNVTLHKGMDNDNETLSEDSFFDRITNARWLTRENNIQFLVGNIGDGKTTYICNLIYRRWGSFFAQDVVPIRINFDTTSEHTVLTIAAAGKIIYDQIIQSLRLNEVISSDDIDEIRRNTQITLSSDVDHVLTMLANLLRHFQSLKRKTLLLVIDNIDFLYHIGDRGAFSRELHADQRRAYEAILELVRMFAREDQICANIGLNILYCLREDTLEYMNSKRDEVPFADIADRCACLQSNSKNVESTLRVVESRFDLVIDLANGIPVARKSRDFVNQVIQLRNRYRELASRATDGLTIRLFDHLWQLSRRGLRDVMDQMSKYSWIENSEEKIELNWRFNAYSPAVLAYIMGGRRRYQQFVGGVPNLYLINATAPSNEFGVHDEFKKPHFSTYWLKRLILHFLAAKKGEYVAPSDVVDVFCGRNKRAYSEPLVRYTLGVLAQVPQSECVEVQIGASGSGGDRFYVANIKLTRRGRFLIEDFADGFAYLQLMIDDWRLRLPRELKSDFEYVDPDYRYLVSQDHDYVDQVKTVLEKKSKQTLMFALLLEEHFRFEKEAWPKVFERLRDAGVNLERFESIVAHVVRDIDRITSRSPARPLAFDVYCGAEFLLRQRERVRTAVRKIGAPQLDFMRKCYE